MKIGPKILLSYLLVFGLAFYYLTYDFSRNIKFRYLEGVEDSLVDQAQILSTFVSIEMEENAFPAKKLYRIFDRTYSNNFSAQIYRLNKSSVDLRVYITDKKGILIFDSKNKANIGADYSQWRDVYLTLKGKYGARSSKEDPRNPDSSILYVAAPIIINAEIAGVLTIGKPTTSINNFLKLAKKQIKKRSIITGFFVVIASILMMFLITKPIKLLTKYANDIRGGKKAELPKLDNSEIGEMGKAFERMREALEGKKYVEQYVQILTHEIKSPISAIRGASELLEEDMTQEQRLRFLLNIQSESKRIQQLLERMLALSSLENTNVLKKRESIQFKKMVESVFESMSPLITQKKLKLINNLDKEVIIKGNAFLLRQAISNLIQNAIDFSPSNGQIAVSTSQGKGCLHFTVEDQGPGIPDFAQKKIFNKFFSMQRPKDEKKSTGLGLNFVKEISDLHNGKIKIENILPNGICAKLSLPLENT